MIAQLAAGDEGSFYQCRAIASIEKRVACYDSIVDSMTLKPVVEVATGSIAADKRVVELPDSEALFGKNMFEAKRMVEKSLSLKQVNQIEAEVTAVRKSSNRKLTITLANGQVWQQLDSGPMVLKTGEIIVVRAARLGSFKLSKQSGGGSIRVKRRN